MAPLKIYWGSGSTPAWRVLVCLEEKGLSYESKILQFSKSELSPQKCFLSLTDCIPWHCKRTLIALRHRARHVLRDIPRTFGLSKTSAWADTSHTQSYMIPVFMKWPLLGVEDSGIQDQHYET